MWGVLSPKTISINPKSMPTLTSESYLHLIGLFYNMCRQFFHILRQIISKKSGTWFPQVRTLLRSRIPELAVLCYIRSMKSITLSDISMYRRCPRLYAFSRQKDLATPLPLHQYAQILYRKAVKQIDYYLIRKQIVPVVRLKNAFRTAWQNHHRWLKTDSTDDYLEHQMMAITLQSLTSYVNWIGSLTKHSLVHSMSTMDIRLTQTMNFQESGASSADNSEEILFVHRFHGILRDEYGRFFIVVHRFGSHSPEVDPENTDLIASSFVFWKTMGVWPAGFLIWYPWLNQYMEVGIDDEGTIRRFDEMLPLIYHILNSRSFPTHPSDHCPTCRYFNICPAFYNKTPIRLLQDPDTRCIDYFFEIVDQC